MFWRRFPEGGIEQRHSGGNLYSYSDGNFGRRRSLDDGDADSTIEKIIWKRSAIDSELEFKGDDDATHTYFAGNIGGGNFRAGLGSVGACAGRAQVGNFRRIHLYAREHRRD